MTTQNDITNLHVHKAAVFQRSPETVRDFFIIPTIHQSSKKKKSVWSSTLPK